MAVRQKDFWTYVIQCLRILDTLNAPADAVGVNFGEWETAISKDKTRYLFLYYFVIAIYSQVVLLAIVMDIFTFLLPQQRSSAKGAMILHCNVLLVTVLQLKIITVLLLDPYEDYDEKDWNEAATKFSFLTSLTLHDDIHTLQTTIMKMDKRFDDIDKRFEVMDKRFEVMDKRFEVMDKKFDKRFEDMDKRFEVMDKRFEVMDKRFEDMDKSIDGKFSQIMALLQQKPSPT